MNKAEENQGCCTMTKILVGDNTEKNYLVKDNMQEGVVAQTSRKESLG